MIKKCSTCGYVAFKVNLSKHQSKYLEAVDWLLDNNANRASGRSYLMAVVFIGCALRHPNTEIIVFDHWPFEIAHRQMLRLIKNLLSQDEELLKRTEFKQKSFRIKL